MMGAPQSAALAGTAVATAGRAATPRAAGGVLRNLLFEHPDHAAQALDVGQHVGRDAALVIVGARRVKPGGEHHPHQPILHRLDLIDLVSLKSRCDRTLDRLLVHPASLFCHWSNAPLLRWF